MTGDCHGSFMAKRTEWSVRAMLSSLGKGGRSVSFTYAILVTEPGEPWTLHSLPERESIVSMSRLIFPTQWAKLSQDAGHCCIPPRTSYPCHTWDSPRLRTLT